MRFLTVAVDDDVGARNDFVEDEEEVIREAELLEEEEETFDIFLQGEVHEEEDSEISEALDGGVDPQAAGLPLNVANPAPVIPGMEMAHRMELVQLENNHLRGQVVQLRHRQMWAEFAEVFFFQIL